MARKTKEEALRTRERILDAAVDEFHDRGVARPSLTDVAARIGMTRGAVYGHFRNKGEVLLALFERERLPWEACGAEGGATADAGDASGHGGPGPCGDPLDALRRELAALLRHPSEHPMRARTLNILFYKVELAVEHAALVERLSAAREETHAHLLALVRRAAAAGRLPAGRDAGRDARFLQQAVFGVLLDWVWDPARFDLAAEADALAAALVAAISAPAPAQAPAADPGAPPAGAGPGAPLRADR